MSDLVAPPSAQPAAQPTPPPPGTTKSPDDRATEFRPVQGAPELQSGERLLVYAYSAFWLVAFVFIVVGWRRQRSLDGRVASLESAVARARKDAEAGKGS